MHQNVNRGNIIHTQHFKAIEENNYLASGWEVRYVNQKISILGLRPDWILINKKEKRAFIVDITTKYTPRHYKKGLMYINELRNKLTDPGWEIKYIEDYWLNAVIH